MPPSKGQPIHLNFDLRLEPWQDGYRALVVDSPVSSGASSRFSLPDLGLPQAGQPGPGGQRATVRKLVPAESSPPRQQAGPLAPAALGQVLFEKVFQGEVLSFLRRSQDQVVQQGSAGLRIRLLLSDVPELAQLGWEYLYDAGHAQFLCLSAQTPVVRFLDVLRSREPARIDPPLQILVMISAPNDQPPLDVEGEWARLSAALAGLVDQKQVVVHRLDAATLGALQQQLRRGAYHIFHFIGHGAFDDQAQDGLLVFEDEGGRGHPVSSQVLGTLLHDEPSLRLALLNACEGARGSRNSPFAGIAQTLVQKGIPAVVAMQTPITDGAAKTLAHEFYLALADGYSVDAALAEARKAIYRQGSELEWGVPVLFMHSADGVLWRVAGEEENEVTEEQDRPWWEGLSVQTEGDVIIGFAGAGAQQTTIGKEITIMLGETKPADGPNLEEQLAGLEGALQRLGSQLDPQIAMMAGFQLNLLKGELVKAGGSGSPSANTITQVGDWLLDNVPQLAGDLHQLFAMPAAGRALGQAGDDAVRWAKNRFGAGG